MRPKNRRRRAAKRARPVAGHHLPYDRKPFLEHLEDRLCLSAAYDFEIIAQTGVGGIISLGDSPSINDDGSIAFTGEDAGGHAVFRHSTGGLERIGSTTSNGSFGESASIDDSGQAVARLRIAPGAGNPTRFIVRGYPDRTDYVHSDDLPAGTFIQEYVASGYGVVAGRLARSVVHVATDIVDGRPTGTVGIWETISFVGPNGDVIQQQARQAGGSEIQTLKPDVADNGAFVVQTKTPSNEPIILYEPRFNGDQFVGFTPTFIAGRSRFSDLGLSPGISDDGRHVAFYGVLTNDGADAINSSQPEIDPLSPGPGAFLSSSVSNGRVIQRIAGISRNGHLDPGEDWIDENDNGVVDIGEDSGIFAAFDPDSAQNVEVQSGVGRLFLLGTDASDTVGLYISRFQVSLSTGEARHVEHSPAVQVGDIIPGISTPVSDLHYHHGLNRLGIITFVAEFGATESAVIKGIAERPAVLNVATHGFGNGLFPNFLANWVDLGATLDAVPADGQELAGQVATYVANWDSSDGWIKAATSFLVGTVYAIADLPLAAAKQFALVGFHMARARQQAESAAAMIVSDLISSGLLTSPAATQNGIQRIHLIGHSRGAAVNARVAELLVEKKYRIDQYTSLDGYSADWPHGSAILSDIDIVHELSGLSADVGRIVNYRVEAGLALVLFDLVSNFVKSYGEPILQTAIAPLGAAIRLLLENHLVDWRAPCRNNFENYLLEGLVSVGKPSAHFNVGDFVGAIELYKDSADRQPPRLRYILDNYAGVFSGMEVDRPIAEVCDASPIGPIAQRVAESPSNFVDGNFEELADLVQLFATTEFPATGDEALDAWVEVSRLPSELISSVWEIAGDVSLEERDENAILELRQTDATSVGQLLVFDAGVDHLEFDLAVLETDVEDRLEVVFKDANMETVVADIVLANLNEGGHQVVSLRQLAGRHGYIVFRLVGPGSDPAVIHLDNLEIHVMANELAGDTNDDGRVDIDDLNSVRNNFGTTGPADGTLTGDAYPFDGLVNIDDLNAVRNNFGKTLPAVPPRANDDEAETLPGTPVVIDVVGNDVDSDGAIDPKTVTIVDGPDNGMLSVDPANGEVTYTPNAGFSGTDFFSYTVKDIEGIASNTAIVTILVAADNTPPVARDDEAFTTVDMPVTIRVLDNDTDPDGTLDPTTVTIVTQPTGGQATVNPTTGEFLYTPNPGFADIDTFEYTVRDDLGAVSNKGKVTVNMVEHNTLLGDMNGDGNLSEADLEAFDLAILSRALFRADFPNVDPDIVGDINGDGIMNNLDRPLLVSLLDSVFRPDRFEPNDSFDIATNLGTVDARSEMALTVHLPENEDFFQFLAGKSGPMRINIDFAHADGDLDLILYDVTREQIAASTSIDDNESILIDLHHNQRYFLRVVPKAGVTHPNYRLVIADAVPPSILSIDPPSGAIRPAGLESIRIDFSEAVQLPPEDVFELIHLANGARVPLTIQQTQ